MVLVSVTSNATRKSGTGYGKTFGSWRHEPGRWMREVQKPIELTLAIIAANPLLATVYLEDNF